MEIADYSKIKVGKIETVTLLKMFELSCLTQEHMDEWKQTFEMIKEKRQEWAERKRDHLLEGVKWDKVEFVECTWRKWPLDEIRSICENENYQVEEPQSISDGYNPKHTTLNKLMKRYPAPVLNDKEDCVTKEAVVITKANVEIGKYVIIRGDVQDCIVWKHRPIDHLWVAKILSLVDEQGYFSYFWVPVLSSMRAIKGRRYDLSCEDPDVRKCPREHLEAVQRIFSKSAGFNLSGSLKGSIWNKFRLDPQVIKSTEEYDKLVPRPPPTTTAPQHKSVKQGKRKK